MSFFVVNLTKKTGDDVETTVRLFRTYEMAKMTYDKLRDQLFVNAGPFEERRVNGSWTCKNVGVESETLVLQSVTPEEDAE